MSGPKDKGPARPPDDEDWASALDEWDAQIDNALGTEAAVEADPEILATEIAVPMLPPRGEAALDEPAPLDEPPAALGTPPPFEPPTTLDDSMAVDAPPIDLFGMEMVTAPQEALPRFSLDSDGDPLDGLSETGDDEATGVRLDDAATGIRGATLHVLDDEAASDVEIVDDPPPGGHEALLGPDVPAGRPSYDDHDEDLEVSMELSTTIEQVVQQLETAPALQALDDDFYDDIAIIPGRDEPSVKMQPPQASPKEDEDDKLWSEPSLVAQRSDEDPDRTPLPVAEEVPGHHTGLHLTITGELTAIPQCTLQAVRATLSDTTVERLERGDTLVALTASDRHSLRRLLDAERALADRQDAAQLAFEAARFCLELDDIEGAVERAEAAIAAQPQHDGALQLLRRAAIARGDHGEAADLLAKERAEASLRESAGLAIVASALDDVRGLHDQARAHDVSAADAAGRFVAMAWNEGSDEIAASRALIVDPADVAVASALDLAAARVAERDGKLEAAIGTYRTELVTEGRNLHAALGLWRCAVAKNERDLEREALGALAACLPVSRLRGAVERRWAALDVASGAVDAGRDRLAGLADTGDSFASLLWSTLASTRTKGDAEICRLSRVAEASSDPGQRADALFTLGAAEEARGQTGAAITAYGSAAEAFPVDTRADRALARVRSIGGDKQIELDRQLRLGTGDEGRAGWALVRAATLLVELGRGDEAMGPLEQVLSRNALDGEALALFEKLAVAANDPARAADRLVASADDTDDAALALALRRRALGLYAHAGAFDRGYPLLALWQDPVELGDLVRTLGLGDLQRARDQLGRVAETGSPYQRARASWERSTIAPSNDEAVDDLRLALSAAPQLSRAAASLARITADGHKDRASVLEARHAALAADGELEAPTEERISAALEAALALGHDDNEPARALIVLETGSLLASSRALRAQYGELARRRGAEAGLRTVYEPLLAQELPPETRASLLYEWARATQRANSTEGVSDRLWRAHEAMPEVPLYRCALERALERAGDTARLTELALLDLREAQDTRSKVLAYQKLAFIDEALRGDVGSARMSYESIAELDQNDHDAARRLERHLIAERRKADLVHLYDRLGMAASEPTSAVATSLERARLRRAVADNALDNAEIAAAVDNDVRLVLFQNPRSRPALQEAYARATERRDHAQRGRLAQRLAEQFQNATSPDLRAAAIFLCRAAESALLSGQHDEALARLREALACSERHLPALLGLLELTLKRRDLAGAAYVAEQVQQVQREAVARHDSGMLAAAIAVRDLDDRPRAVRVLRAVLEADPKASLAFERLRSLLAEEKDWAGLVALITAHLESTTHPQEVLELRVELGRIFTSRLDDADQARVHFTAALEVNATDADALGALANLEQRQGRYQEAAELLMRRAKVERSRTALATLLFRLGVLYTRHLDEPTRAVACLVRVLQMEPGRRDALELLADAHEKASDFPGAFAALQQLISLEADPAAKMALLHRAGRIQEDGLKEPRHALVLFRAALELDPLNITAIEAVAQFFDRQSDVQSLRVLMDTTARRLRSGLSGGPRDVAAFRSLYKVFTLRRASDRAAITAGVLEWMGPISPEERQALDRLRTREQYPGSALALPAVDDLLFDGGVTESFRNLMRVVEEPLGKSFKPDLKQLGVGRSDRLPRSGHAVREIGNRIAADLGIDEFEIYVSAALKQPVILELTDPLSLCISAELLEGAHELQLRFLFGRMFKMVQSRLSLSMRLPADALALLVAGMVRQFVPDYLPRGMDAQLVAAEAVRVQRALSRKMLQEAHPFALECAAPGADPRTISASVMAAADRAGLLACGAPGPALTMLERMGHADAARALALFAVGDELSELRRLIGTSIG